VPGSAGGINFFMKDVEEICQLSIKAANDLVKAFEENEWLRKIGSAER
jgi:hypothetical protein